MSAQEFPDDGLDSERYEHVRDGDRVVVYDVENPLAWIGSDQHHRIEGMQ